MYKNYILNKQLYYLIGGGKNTSIDILNKSINRKKKTEYIQKINKIDNLKKIFLKDDEKEITVLSDDNKIIATKIVNYFIEELKIFTSEPAEPSFTNWTVRCVIGFPFSQLIGNQMPSLLISILTRFSKSNLDCCSD